MKNTARKPSSQQWHATKRINSPIGSVSLDIKGTPANLKDSILPRSLDVAFLLRYRR
jgi:hypothetical protein